MSRRILCVLFVVSLIASVAVPAQATLIGLTNGDFEADTVSNKQNRFAATTGWYCNDAREPQNGNQYYGYNYIRKDSTQYSETTNVFNFDNGTLGYAYQQIGTYTPGEQVIVGGLLLNRGIASPNNYTYQPLIVQIWRTDAGTSGSNGTHLSSLAGATLLDSITIAYSDVGLPTYGRTPAQASWSATLSEVVGGTAGTPLWLRLAASAGGGYQITSIDDITVSGVPEPSALLLLACGLISLLAYAWRKRK